MITAVTWLAIGLLVAPALSDTDRAKLVAELEASQKALVETVQGLSEAQLKFKAGPDRWSVAECTEHLAATEPFLFGYIEANVLKTPIASEAARAKASTATRDDTVVQRMADRTQKAQAPKEIAPTGRWTTRDALLGAFKENRAKTIAWVKSTEVDLRGHLMAGFGGGPELDGYQWISTIPAHTRRHLAQIKEVMANPNFPKQ